MNIVEMNEPINGIRNIEDKFTDKLGHSDKILGCNTKVFTEIISVLIIIDALFFFIQTYFRWGAPCFLWWNSFSTTITFMFGHGIRLIGIPTAIYAITSVRKGDIRGTRQLFYYLFFASIVSGLDIFLSISEVHNVCNSDSIRIWNDCEHEWGKQEYLCLREDNEICLAGLVYDNMEVDRRNCLSEDCHYIPNTEYVKPECCDDSMWLHHNPCSSEPVITNKDFDTDWCESFSDLYDIGIQLLTVTVLLGFAYVVNSHSVFLNRALTFTPNPMDDVNDVNDDDVNDDVNDD